MSAIEVSFGANGEVAPGERIVTPEPEEPSPTVLFLFDFSGVTEGRGGRGGAVLSPLDLVAVTFDVEPLGWTDEGGVEAP